jgi:hypothetical protein
VEVYRINFGGFASTPAGQHDFRDDYRRFSEASAEIDYTQARHEYNEGLPERSSPLFRAAKVEAAKMAAAGVTADDVRT